MTGMVKKYHIGLFVDNRASGAADPAWVRIKKSTSLELSMNPETQEYDYIVDQNPTTELLRYKISLNQPLTMYKGEADYQMLFDRFFSMKTGDEAKTNVLVVFMQEDEEKTRTIPPEQEGGDPTTETYTAYKAWQNEAVLSFSSLNGVDSSLTVDINFGGKTLKGYAYPDTENSNAPIFVEDATVDDSWQDPFEA